MEQITINAERRTRWEMGKGHLKRLRAQGFVPAVMYGYGTDSVALKVEGKLLDRLLHQPSGKNRTYVLKMDENTQKEVLIKDYQLDPTRDELTHIDFLAVQADRPVHVKVPIEIEGVSIGVKNAGGMMDVLLHVLPVECLPADIPEKITLNVAALDINQSLRVRDIHLGDKVTVLTDVDRVIVHIEGTRSAASAESATAEKADAKK